MSAKDPYKSVFGTNATDRSVMAPDELDLLDGLCEEADNHRGASMERRSVALIARLAREIGEHRKAAGSVEAGICPDCANTGQVTDTEGRVWPCPRHCVLAASSAVEEPDPVLVGKTGHYLSADRMRVFGIVDGRIFSSYQVSALLQHGKMPKLLTPGGRLGFTPSENNDAVKWIRALENGGFVLDDSAPAAQEQKPVAELEVRQGIVSLKHTLAPMEQFYDGMKVYASPIPASREGWQLVPKLPTDEQIVMMMRAIHQGVPEVLDEILGLSDMSEKQIKRVRDGYAAALAGASALADRKR